MATATGISNRNINEKNSNSNKNNDVDVKSKREESFLTKYFFIILFVFAASSILLNNRYAHSVHQETTVVGSVLKDFHNSKKKNRRKIWQPPRTEELKTTIGPSEGGNDNDNDDDKGSAESNKNDDDDDNNIGGSNDKELKSIGKNHPNEEEKETNVQAEQEQQQQHMIANLSCERYGGPSNKDAQEMVYWEDIPTDALHISPFHLEHPDNNNNNDVQPITKFLTFESDGGGWNNIRMAMETVLAMSFAMGRTLVLPPHQGMYLIDKDNGTGDQKRKFSYNDFFHMESISAEHIGLNIITMKEFLELCVQGKVVVGGDTLNSSNNKSSNNATKTIYPPDMRTDWDGAPSNEQSILKKWLRKFSGENLLHWDCNNCLAAFPKSNTESDTKELEALPAQILQSEGGFPHYEAYIGKPNPVDASPIERLKEMNAERKRLCVYTPEIQNKQWIHFPVGMETTNHDTSRLLVHFYAFLFFQDWKQDLWMKRFVRDHVRYVDEIQCAAARIITTLRKRVSERTSGKSNDFDTIHIRRGDFQYKETRVDADKILEQLKKVLDDSTTIYICTDERDKTFFQSIIDHYADVVFLDDFKTELEGLNTNYYGMVDQLVASRGKIFFGCWFSTFTGYINRLRGYHTDDHKLPGYEKGIIPSYYYAMSDRFDHMQKFFPVKKQFYAREFPTSWRLIDTSLDVEERQEKK